MSQYPSIDIFYYVVVWWVPYLFMWLWFFRDNLLDWINLRLILIATFGPAVAMLILNVVMPDIFSYFSWMPLFTLYGLMGLFFAYDLRCRGWHVMRAFTAAAMCVYLGSFYWETPLILRNAFITGFENDWLAHLQGLVYLGFTSWFIGWKRMWPLPLGLIIGSLAIFLPTNLGWNTTPFLLIRGICTIIVYAMLRKDVK